MNHDTTKPTKWVCVKRRLRSAWASAQSDQSSICAQWVAKDPRFLHADSEDSDQTGWMPRLIWVFTGRTAILLVLSCRGSFITWYLPACVQYYLHFYQAPNSSHILWNMGNPLKIICIVFISKISPSDNLLCLIHYLGSPIVWILD